MKQPISNPFFNKKKTAPKNQGAVYVLLILYWGEPIPTTTVTKPFIFC